MASPSRRARVLVFVKGLGLGGAEKLIAESAPIWAEGDFDYHVAYMLPWKNNLVGVIEDSGVGVTCVEWSGARRAQSISHLRRLVDEFAPEIVHSHLPMAGILARTVLPGPRHVYTEHNIVDFYKAPTRLANRVTYGRNHKVVAVSSAVAESLVGYPGPSPIVIPNGVPSPAPRRSSKAVRSELGIADSTRLVVHVGNIRPHKGHHNLIEAVSHLSPDAEVFVASIGGEKHPGDLERHIQTIKDLGVGEKIRLLGRREDAADFVAAADLVVNPAEVEGLPLSILEALALSKPVVATNVGGVPSIIHHEVTGLLVPPSDPTGLADAIARALDSEQARSWGEAGEALVREHHGIRQMVAAQEALYRDVLDA